MKKKRCMYCKKGVSQMNHYILKAGLICFICAEGEAKAVVEQEKDISWTMFDPEIPDDLELRPGDKFL